MKELNEKEEQFLESFADMQDFFKPILEHFRLKSFLTDSQYYWLNLFIKISQTEDARTHKTYYEQTIVKIPCPHCNFLCPTRINHCPKCGEPLPRIDEIYKKFGVSDIQDVDFAEKSIIYSLEKQINRPIHLKDMFDINSTCCVKVNDDITCLSLSNCKLDYFPSEILKLTSLKHLALRRNNIPSLLNNIGFLSDLEYLNLRLNKLKTLPASIGLLSKLKYLNLSSNDLMEIPESIGNLGMLKELNLSNNKLNNIPDSIGKLKSLEKLNIQANFWMTLPESILKLKEQGLQINK